MDMGMKKGHVAVERQESFTKCFKQKYNYRSSSYFAQSIRCLSAKRSKFRSLIIFQTVFREAVYHINNLQN